MREHKYRAWHPDDKVMIYDLNTPSLCHGVLIGEDYILMQYIGLKDKNGKEIYEGDILYFEVENEISSAYNGGKPGVIKFDDRKSCYYIHTILNKNVTINHGYDAYGKTLQIIGNIYENPELLND